MTLFKNIQYIQKKAGEKRKKESEERWDKYKINCGMVEKLTTLNANGSKTVVK